MARRSGATSPHHRFRRSRRPRLRITAGLALTVGLLVPASAGPAAADATALLDAPCGGNVDPARTPAPAYLQVQDGRYIDFDIREAVLESGGNGINDVEMISGVYVDAANAYHGFLCDNSGTVRNIEVPHALGTGPNKLNNNGQVVGRYSTNDGNIQNLPTADLNGFLWNNGQFTFIDVPGTRTQTVPWDINDAGRVVGEYTDANGVRRGFLWQNGQFLDINVVHPAAGDDPMTGTAITGINNNGDMVGYYVDDAMNSVGFLLRGDGTFVDLPAPDGVDVIFVSDINDNRQIAGVVGNTTAQTAAGFVLRDGINGPLTPVAFPGSNVSVVGGINNDVEVVGAYVQPSSSARLSSQGSGNPLTSMRPGPMGLLSP